MNLEPTHLLGLLRATLLAGFLVVPATTARAGGDQPPRAVTPRGLENLVAFTRLVGYVRWFHPSDEAAALDWDAFTIAAIDSVESAETPAELASTLRRLFGPIAPTVSVDVRPVLVDSASATLGSAALTGSVAWRHRGFGTGIADNPEFKSRRTRHPLAGPGARRWDSDAFIATRLERSVWCAVPLLLYTDASGTVPRAPPAAAPRPARSEAWKPSGDDRATRLAAVAIFWNAAQHFYPYLREVGSDWPAALREALQRASADPDARSFHDTLARLMAGLRDSHGWVYDRYVVAWPLPLAWDWIEDRLVIVDAPSDSNGGPRRGDEVIAIDGVSVADRFAEVAPLIGASTPQSLRWNALAPLGRGAGKDSVTLELRDPAGAVRTMRVARRRPDWKGTTRRPMIDELRPGVLYVDLDRITTAQFDSALARLSEARGIVFDLRGYPRRFSISRLGHLLRSPATTYRMSIPDVWQPDGRRLLHRYSQTTVQPREPRITARVAFLMDGRAQSAAEHYLGVIAGARIAELVGSPTAGADGNAVLVPLPGDYRIRFTGMHVVRHDGSPFHGGGVFPTVPVSRTIAGVAAGRDEVLEKAIEIVSRED